MATVADRNCTHLAGEFFVAAELSRRGYAVGLTMGNAKAIDLFAERGGRTVNVQVKAIAVRKNIGWPIMRDRIVPNVVYVLVCLNPAGEPPNYYVLTSAEAVEKTKQYSTRGIIDLSRVRSPEYTERWDKVEAALGIVSPLPQEAIHQPDVAVQVPPLPSPSDAGVRQQCVGVATMKDRTIAKHNGYSQQLSEATSAVPANLASEEVSRSPGVYAIFVDTPDSLPKPFAALLRATGNRLLYVGCSDVSIHQRLVKQDLQQGSPSTFYRGIGAILGFRPPAGSLRGKSNQNNYRFSAPDAAKINAWINKHLSVRWKEMSVDELRVTEPAAIAELRPLLNTTHNPACCQELADLREECREIARGI